MHHNIKTISLLCKCQYQLNVMQVHPTPYATPTLNQDTYTHIHTHIITHSGRDLVLIRHDSGKSVPDQSQSHSRLSRSEEPRRLTNSPTHHSTLPIASPSISHRYSVLSTTSASVHCTVLLKIAPHYASVHTLVHKTVTFCAVLNNTL